MRKVEFGQIIKQVYRDIFASCSETDSKSSSSGYIEIVMEIIESYIVQEVLRYTQSSIDDKKISTLLSERKI